MKVLVCDDEYATRLLTKTYLGMMGIQALEASDGREALDVIRDSEPDLMIIDYSMPVMTGLDVLKQLGGKPPAIVVTSEGFSEEIESDLRKYAAGYLVKPVTLDNLKEMVEKITGGPR